MFCCELIFRGPNHVLILQDLKTPSGYFSKSAGGGGVRPGATQGGVEGIPPRGFPSDPERGSIFFLLKIGVPVSLAFGRTQRRRG